MAYIPKLDKNYSAQLRRLAWGCGKTMSSTLKAIIDDAVNRVDSSIICEECQDESYCDRCNINSKSQSKNFDSLINLLPRQHRHKKTIIEAIKYAYEVYGYDHVAGVLQYTNKYVGNYRALLFAYLRHDCNFKNYIQNINDATQQSLF